MPRTRKMYSWTVSFANQKLVVKSKTKRGACCKALKKADFKIPRYDQYTGEYPGVSCIKN